MQKPIVPYFFGAIFLLTLFLFIKLTSPFLVPFVLAVILVTVFSSLHESMKKIFKTMPSCASLATCGVIVIFVALPVVIFLGLLSKEAFELFIWAKERVHTENIEQFLVENPRLSSQLKSIENTFNINLAPEQLKNQVGGLGAKIGLFLYNQAKAITTNVFSVIFNFLILFFILFYLFRDGDRFLKRIMEISPLLEKQERYIIQKFKEVGSAVFWGNMVSAIFQGAAAGLGVLIFGVGNSILLGLSVALTALIPAVGPLLIYVPAGLYLMATGDYPRGIGLILYGIIVSNVIDNIIKPKMIENKIKVHPMLIFLSLIGGVQVFGILGVLYGPLIVTLFLTMLEIYETDFS